MKSLTEINLYELMGEHHDIWISRNAKFGFNVHIDDDNYEPLIREDGVHPCAIEGFAEFCRRFLVSYENALMKDAA